MAANARQLGPGLALAYDESERENQALKDTNRRLRDANERLIADNAALMAENLDMRRRIDELDAAHG